MIKAMILTEQEAKQIEVLLQEKEERIKVLERELKKKQEQIAYLAEFKRQVEKFQ